MLLDYATQVRVLGLNHPSTAVTRYNLAAIEIHKGNRDETLRLLPDSVDHGLPPWAIKEMPTDPDLKSLHGDPRFTALLAYASGRASSSKVNEKQ